MKLEFRQRLLATTLLVSASTLSWPVFAQDAAPPANPADTAGAGNAQPETTAPPEGQSSVPSTNAQGGTVKSTQDIVITGTRIPQPNLTSASPVTVLSSQEIKLQGTTRTEDLINSLPQSFAAQGSNVSNGATGTATVNLRGLGAQRTLVLINGRRLQPGDPRAGSVADINFIPSSLVKRVDVLTGGASSVYGADAVAGVVNFIMDTNFTGLRIDAQASTFMHDNRGGDKRVIRAMTDPNVLGAFGFTAPFRYPKGISTNGGAQDISAAFGTRFADGRGHIMAYATYRSQDPVLESSRDYSFCALGAFNPQYVSTYGEFYCAGSSTSAAGTFRVANPVTGVLTRTQFHVAGNQFAPGSVPFNFAPYNYFQRPDERYTLGTFAEYEIAPGAKPYLEAMFMDDTSDAVIAPSGSFYNVGQIACDNAMLSAQEQAALCGNPALTFTGSLNGQQNVQQARVFIGRRNVEGGGRQDNIEHTAWRIVGGMRGDLLKGVSYDAYYQFGTTRLDRTYTNDFSVTRLNRATDAIAVLNGVQVAPGTPGAQIVCRATFTGVDPNCVPWNIFQAGGVTQAAIDYLSTPGFQRAHVNETVANTNFTLEGAEYGLQTPWSDRGVGINVGAEYRKESIVSRSDVEFATGDLAGQGGPTPNVAGSFDVRELFTEVQVPIVSHSFIDEFSLNGGYRYSDYKVAGDHFSTNTYKISAELAPVRDVRLRASYNRAVRAPNIVELFFPTTVGLAGAADPCAGDFDPTTRQGAPTFTLAQCQLMGVSSAQYGNVPQNPAVQYNGRFSGNVNLKPEKADTYTLGVVLQPRFLPGFAFTADYFDIKVKDLIAPGLGYSNVLNFCAASGDPAVCGLVNRDTGGTLWLTPAAFVDLPTINIGGLRTKGVDINGSYTRKLGGLGTLNLSLVGTWLKELEVDTGLVFGPAGLDGKYRCEGLYGITCGNPSPKWRHKFRVGFTLPNGLGISGQWRYFSAVKDDVVEDDPDMPGSASSVAPVPDRPGDHRLAAKSFFDLALTARIGDKLNLRLGANNIFDTEPPLASGNVVAPPFGNGNTFPQVYDALGRFMFAGVTVDF
jgi:outer membrane receptor protein involved in Fe transport